MARWSMKHLVDVCIICGDSDERRANMIIMLRAWLFQSNILKSICDSEQPNFVNYIVVCMQIPPSLWLSVHGYAIPVHRCADRRNNKKHYLR